MEFDLSGSRVWLGGSRADVNIDVEDERMTGFIASCSTQRECIDDPLAAIAKLERVQASSVEESQSW
ncbi:hypothetical protein X797_007471 [Metarhizium robertsii]|uniref:Uncharacterized protein n=1 Tax=Metarhizium robertsii TaxID=568076 RepID=A0A014P7Y8_9HYPO|nr:hypothetical protein X797_007471 [Metarhizium robertsii]